jgi:nucleoside-diphosphate-sugar epimerase
MSKGSILIVGGSGFIGTHYASKFIKSGVDVYIVDIVEPRIKHELVKFVQHDVRALSSLTIDVKFDIVFNFAAIHTTPGHQIHEYYESNVLGAVEVCKFAEKNKIEEIVFTSSISVYGPGEEQKDEYTELTPNSAYGFSKMLAERIHKSWMERAVYRKLTIVRPAVVFGPGEGGNFTRLATLMRKGTFIYPGRKDTIKACIYVEDLISLVDPLCQTTCRAHNLIN